MGGGGDNSSIGKKSTVQKLDKTKKTPTDSRGIMQAFAHEGETYGPKSWNQLKVEDYTIIIRAEVYTPISMVEHTSFRRLIGNLDGCVTPISRTRLTWKLIPEKVWQIKVTVVAHLDKLNFICLSFDLWMTRIMEESPPSKPMECVHGNTSICTLEYYIQKLELMASISVFPFWN